MPFRRSAELTLAGFGTFAVLLVLANQSSKPPVVP